MRYAALILTFCLLVLKSFGQGQAVLPLSLYGGSADAVQLYVNTSAGKGEITVNGTAPTRNASAGRVISDFTIGR